MYACIYAYFACDVGGQSLLINPHSLGRVGRPSDEVAEGEGIPGGPHRRGPPRHLQHRQTAFVRPLSAEDDQTLLGDQRYGGLRANSLLIG